MSPLDGAFQIVTLVVVAGGAAKLATPQAFATTLRSIGLRSVGVRGGIVAARAVGAVELSVGLAVLWFGGRVAALVIGCTYLAFTVVTIAARRAGVASCGCFGAAAAPPSAVHVFVNSLSAAVAFGATLDPPGGLPEVLGAQPLLGIPYVLLVVTGAWLIVVIDTVGSTVVDHAVAVQRLRPTFQANSGRSTGASARRVHRHVVPGRS